MYPIIYHHVPLIQTRYILYICAHAPAPQDKKLKDAPAGLPSQPVNLPKVDPSPEVVGSKDREMDPNHVYYNI